MAPARAQSTAPARCAAPALTRAAAPAPARATTPARAAALALAAVLSLVLTACGHGSAPSAAGPRPISSDDPRFQPLDAYDLTDEEADTIGRARWTLAKDCMAGLGFGTLRELDVDPVPDWPRRPAQSGVFAAVMISSTDARYGVTDPAEAARYGYRAPAVAYERRHPQRTWTLEEYLALAGPELPDDPKSVHGHRIPERGCLGQAQRRIYGEDPWGRKDPVWTLGSESLQQARRDPAWKRAEQAWSACMRAAGFHYATPAEAQEGRDRLQDAMAHASGPLDLGRPTPLDKRVATADARCKHSSGYLRTVHALDVRIQNTLVARHRDELRDQRRYNEQAVRTARAVLDQHD
ncbi:MULTISPECIES: hypothetical protein [Streptomyces]|uniref:Lipoprotein n=1 Tax=Streptomyces griseosporeus TaxID=1910 RepID=A0ABV3KF42_STRGS|nr:hypothetical protein [Streptomyces actuosus]